MKKASLLLLSVLLFVPLHGQDTITDGDDRYLFWGHTAPLWLEDTIPIIDPNHPIKIFSLNLATSGTLVYGVSIRGDLPLDSSINVSLVFRDGRDSMLTIHDTAWLTSSVVYRHLTFNAIDSNNSPFMYGEKCNEIYFHRPWLVPDTFYVVARYCQDLKDAMQFDYYGRNKRLVIKRHRDSIWPQDRLWIMNDDIPDFPPNVIHDGYYYSFHPWEYEFPILEPNRTRCRKPTGLHFSERGDTWAILSWDGGSGDLYRVTVEGPDSTFVRETTDTTLLLQNLAPDVLYWVELQSLCNYQYYALHETYVNPGRVRRGFYTSITGITDPEVHPQIVLSPNPASQTVEVSSSQPMTRIEVVDVMGRVVDSFAQANESKATLDVGSLPVGAYLLRIHTPAGLSSRKLLVR